MLYHNWIMFEQTAAEESTVSERHVRCVDTIREGFELYAYRRSA